MSLKNERARSIIAPALQVLGKRFPGKVEEENASAQYITTLDGGVVFGVTGLPFPAPVCAALLSEESIGDYVTSCAKEKASVLISKESGSVKLFTEKDGTKRRQPKAEWTPPPKLSEELWI